MSDVAVVTGAAQGLGLAIAEALHAAGYRVAVCDINLPGVEAVATALDASGETAIALPVDISSKASLEAVLTTVTARWGGVQVSVHNAALTPTTPLMQVSAEEFDKVLSVNLRGTFLSCQVFGAAMAEAGYGRIINMASIAGQMGGTASGVHYASSKGGILTLTKVFARELSPKGVTVNAVAPGPLDLPAVHAMVPKEKLDQVVAAIPVRRLGNPKFVAKIVVELASREADCVSGAAWDINGGLFMR